MRGISATDWLMQRARRSDWWTAMLALLIVSSRTVCIVSLCAL